VSVVDIPDTAVTHRALMLHITAQDNKKARYLL